MPLNKRMECEDIYFGNCATLENWIPKIRISFTLPCDNFAKWCADDPALWKTRSKALLEKEGTLASLFILWHCVCISISICICLFCIYICIFICICIRICERGEPCLLPSHPSHILWHLDAIPSMAYLGRCCEPLPFPSLSPILIPSLSLNSEKAWVTLGAAVNLEERQDIVFVFQYKFVLVYLYLYLH